MPFALVSCGPKEFDASHSVSIITREDGSGTKSAFMELLGLKGKDDPTEATIQNGTAAVLAEVENNMYAIAYDSLGYVTEDVKLLQVDGVDPTIENIKSGEYAISRPLNVVYKTADIEGSPLYSDYLSFLSSSQAQQIISEEGYVSIVDGATTYAVPETPLSGTIQISGSTSLQPLMILLAEAYEQLNGNVSIEVAGGGSGTGYENAENGVSAFGMISEEFASEKAPSCVYSTVAKDGIGIIVNLDNPVEDISLEDLSRLYDVDASPAISSWSELITE